MSESIMTQAVKEKWGKLDRRTANGLVTLSTAIDALVVPSSSSGPDCGAIDRLACQSQLTADCTGRMKENLMTAGIAQAPTALDDAIVRNAEATLETIGRAREAIHTVIFGQEEVVDLTLVTLLAGGHGLLVGVPGPCQDEARGDARHRSRPRCAARAVHARPDALRHPRLGNPRRGCGPPPLLPLRQGARSSPSS